MNTQTVEGEILAVTKAKPQQETETRQTYLQRLAAMMANVPEMDFDQTTPKVQEWTNNAIQAINNSAELPELPAADAEVETATTKAAAADKAVAKVVKQRRSAGNTKDRFGYREGSKTSLVIAKFTTGAKMADIKKDFGSPHYNVLKSLEQAGHTVTNVGGTITVTHKDDAGKAEPEANA
jgi:hypothetical protein